ncbi:MAG: DUF4870 domain-containing protein [Clostridia bacterium]|nr:DUF4870 domain-containing protein [Clostridia bacterium]
MNEKLKCILAYIFSWVGGIVILFGFKDNDPKTDFHAAQSIVIGVGYMIINMAYNFTPIYIPFFSIALSVLYILCLVFGIIKACNEDDPELPIVGGLTKTLFAKKLNG